MITMKKMNEMIGEVRIVQGNDLILRLAVNSMAEKLAVEKKWNW